MNAFRFSLGKVFGFDLASADVPNHSQVSVDATSERPGVFPIRREAYGRVQAGELREDDSGKIILDDWFSGFSGVVGKVIAKPPQKNNPLSSFETKEDEETGYLRGRALFSDGLALFLQRRSNDWVVVDWNYDHNPAERQYAETVFNLMIG